MSLCFSQFRFSSAFFFFIYFYFLNWNQSNFLYAFSDVKEKQREAFVASCLRGHRSSSSSSPRSNAHGRKPPYTEKYGDKRPYTEYVNLDLGIFMMWRLILFNRIHHSWYVNSNQKYVLIDYFSSS
jgi:hypothetical protein